uniref:Proline rich 7 (synaptic) n=1 Tax=Gasterosteus aculeatus aculeatus TaxID=481459 RepID=A0AAQ4QZH6_GASAC
MVMSQGTYTFLACFAGFWLVWALVVLLCCFCSFLQRRLKRGHDERLREQCLRTLPREPPQFVPPRSLSPPLPLQVPHPMPQANWVSMPGKFPVHTDLFGKPPCYEEAVLMEDPPPPYSEVLADPRGGTYLKPAPLRPADPAPVSTSETSKPPATAVFPERGYSSLIRLPSSQRWDSLGTPPVQHGPEPQQPYPAGGPLRPGRHGLQGVHGLRGLEPSCGLPTAFPLLGRSTAV